VDEPDLRGLERRGTKNQRDGNPTLHIWASGKNETKSEGAQIKFGQRQNA
jgi:hypothetical protein